MDFEVLLWFIFIPLKFANFHINPDLKHETEDKKTREKKYWLTIILTSIPFHALPFTFHTHLKCVSKRFGRKSSWGRICCVRHIKKRGKKKLGNGSNVKWIIFWRSYSLNVNSYWGWTKKKEFYDYDDFNSSVKIC